MTLSSQPSAARAGTHKPQAAVVAKKDNHRHAQQHPPVVMGPCFRRDDSVCVVPLRGHFFTIGHSGLGGPNASSPEMVASTL